MPVKVKVRSNRAGIRRMIGEPFMVREVERRAELVRALAVQLSPIRTGRYVASHTVRSGIKPNGAAYARVVNNTPYAIYLERGTSKMRAQRILSRALPAARG
ncbi:HK97 gp10 family phage protein [Micromonospora sp. WMMD737]|uniref:HK97 gp10 family phage protein n=1 Tax=Micromonospora sp. WMMD737 TaxID=3404113 RepID=UPI003B9490A2